MLKPEKMKDGVRHVYDVSSLSSLQRCPRYFHYKEELGALGELTLSRRPNYATTFGHAYHEAIAIYNHALAQHYSQSVALNRAIYYLLSTYKYLTAEVTRDTSRTIETLVRSLVWYDLFFSGNPFELAYINEQPALEFRFEVPISSKRLSGWCDALAYFNGQLYIIDRKTTTKEISETYISSYSPDNQVQGYVFALRAMGLPVAGICIEVAIVLVNSTRFRRLFFDYVEDDGRLDEWKSDALNSMDQADMYTRDQYWPMNRTACTMYGRTCEYNYLCSQLPMVRPTLLKEATVYANKP